MKGLVLKNKKIILKDNLNLPSPKKGEVLVRVKYASVNSYDVETIQGHNTLLKKLAGEISYPVMTGIEFSGILESGGHRFKKGDEVFGYPDLIKGQKSHQEFLSINEDFIALKPTNIDFANSAALPLGALTSLIGLEDVGKIKSGAKVLINGAAGGLGVYAVQIAKIFGAKVSAVVGPGQEDFIKSLGADKIINYKEQKIQNLQGKYDILFELTTRVTFSEIKHLLSPRGIYIPANPFNQLSSMVGNLFRKRKTGFLMVGRGDNKKLSLISKWIEHGKLTTIIDRTYEFAEFQKAFERILEPGKRGRIILKVED